MDRTILHCDNDAFYSTTEEMLNPKLRGKAHAVAGSVEDRNGIILAKSYVAKKYGVKTGEAIWQAKQKCPDLITMPPNYEMYLKYSKLASTAIKPNGDTYSENTRSQYVSALKAAGTTFAEAIAPITSVFLISDVETLEHIPFFSKVALRYTRRRLETDGCKVYIKNIKKG